MPRRSLLPVSIVFFVANTCWSQSAPWHARDRSLRRTVLVNDTAELIQVEMLLHGRSPGTLLLYGRRGRVPFVLLQHGPDDLVRFAFRPIAGQRRYWVYFGTVASEDSNANDSSKPSEHGWRLDRPSAGLLLETRRFRGFDLNSFAALQEAFERSEPLGATLVDRVFHASNPCAPEPIPFLSRYVGTLYIDRPGRYRFFTTSQDCSFLVIDGRVVAAAPGRHRAVPRARFGGTVELGRGPHRFEYWHAAAGTQAIMVAAWQPPGADRPAVVPPQAFHADRMATVRASQLEERSGRDLPDFFPEQLGVVQLPDPPVTLVRVVFRWQASPALPRQGRVRWEFGDGQSVAEQAEPVHVYLHPGEYTVKLSWHRVGRGKLTVASRVRIWPLPARVAPPSEQDTLTAYVPYLAEYDPAKLDAEGLVALARVWRYREDWQQLAQTVLAGLRAEPQLRPEQLDELVQLGLNATRFHLDELQRAIQLLRLAARHSSERRQRFRLSVRLAELLLEVGRSDQAAEVLRMAAKEKTDHVYERRLWLRVQADLAARMGQGDRARELYAQAAALRERPLAETVARRGGYERTVAGLLKEGQLRAAYEALSQWADEFPESKLDGSWHLAAARVALARGQYRQVLRVVADSLAVAPDSSYADQLVWLEVQAALKLGDRRRATQAARTLVQDYPGSPLVPRARELLNTAP